MRRLSRRSLFGLGAGAVAAATLPAPVQAAPLATILPDWWPTDANLASALEGLAHLIGETPWLLPYVERLAVAIPKVNVRDMTEGRRSPQEFAEAAASVAELAADPDQESFLFVYKRLADPEPPAVRTPVPTPVQVADRRIATARIRRLDRNERRRVHRWIDRQPVGAEYPLVRLRPGRKADGDGRDSDFLDVAKPARGPSDLSAYDWLAFVVGRIERPLGSRVTWMPMCSHHSATTFPMYTRDGRLAW